MTTQQQTATTAIITGASRGFGRGIAAALTQVDARVVGVPARDSRPNARALKGHSARPERTNRHARHADNTHGQATARTV